MARVAASNRFLLRTPGNFLTFADNGTDRVAVAQTTGLPITQSAAFTIGGWTKIPLDSGNYIFSEGNSSSLTQVFGLHAVGQGSNKLGLFTRNNASVGGDIVGTVNIIVPGTWQHILMTGTSGNIKIYSNGIYTGQSFTRQTGATTLNLTTWGALGRSSYAGSWGGGLSQGVIFSRVLSDAEIFTLYATGSFDDTGIVSYHLMNEGSGSTAIDSSGNGNTGTITGAVYDSGFSLNLRSLATGRFLVNR